MAIDTTPPSTDRDPTRFRAEGVIPAMITPLTADGDLLEQALRDLLDFVIDGGVDGVFVLGSTGEIFGLSDAQKRRVIEVTVEHTAGRVAVYAGASEITTRDCIKTVHMAQEVGGVDALSVLTPYFLTPTQSELVTHFTAIAAETDLPVLLYNNPGKTMVPISLATAQTLAEVPNIIGVKDSSGNLTTTGDFINGTPDDFAVLIGKDTLIYPALAMGADGIIASTANVAAALISQLYQAYRAGDHDRARELQQRLTPFRHLVDRATFPVILKEGARLAGVDVGHCLAPATEMPESLRDDLRTVVADIIHP